MVSPAPKGKPTRADWEAIERDYRMGKLSLRELEAKHGVGYASISRKATKEGWTKDLKRMVRQATSSAMLQEHATRAQQELTTVVVVAAEVNKQVILKHRSDIAAVRDVAMELLAELSLTTHSVAKIAQAFEAMIAESGVQAANAALQQFTDFMRLHTRVGSAQKLADTLTKLQTLERKAFELDSDDGEQRPELSEALAGFIGQLHQSNSGRLAVVPRALVPKVRP